MTTIDKTKPVMITGATGYVAGWIVKRLLDEGLTVHAPIRSPDNPEKTKYLDALAANAPGTIKYYKADLLQQGSYDDAAAGCELIIHTASPFVTSVKDAKRDLLDPALIGTENVLQTASTTPSVKRVVLTSSCVALYGDAVDTRAYPQQTMTEAHWNTTSSLDHQPYSFSKVMAEKKAWEVAKAQKQWDLVVVNPSFVLGPGINPQATSESFAIVKQMGDGTMKMGCPDFNIGCVDVRDLAQIHYDAGFTPSAEGRHIASAENLSFLALADLVRDKYGATYPLPKKTLPKWLVWLLAPASGLSRKMVANNVGHPWQADNSKSKKALHASYRPMKETMNDFFEQMVAVNAFAKK